MAVSVEMFGLHSREKFCNYIHFQLISSHHLSLKGRSSVFLKYLPDPLVTVFAGVAISLSGAVLGEVRGLKFVAHALLTGLI